jgi:ABC-type lipoprotein export system ATPase subunit
MTKPTKPNKEFLKAKVEFEKNFYRLMFETGLYNKFNKTYLLDIQEETNYGFKALIWLVDGLSFMELEEKISKLQQSLCCIWIMKTIQFKRFAELKIVTKPLDKDYPFQNPQLKPWQIYLGVDFTFKPIVVDMNDHCMFLLSGSTGSGKTRFIYQVLLSWILGCKPNEVDIMLSDIAKNEYINFRNVQHVKYYAQDLEQLYEMMLEVEKKLENRKKTLSRYREKGEATDIREYNKISGGKMSYCVVLIDEFSVVIPDKTDNPLEKEMKQKVLDILKRLSKIGRNHGIFTFIATQKTTKDEMPAIIKNMSAVRVSFRANDYISSEVIIGDGAAVGLADRYAVYSLNGGDRKDYLYSPNLSTEALNSLLEPYIERRGTNTLPTNKNPNVIEINGNWKPYVKADYEVIKPVNEKKTINLKGGEFIDY